LVKRIFTEKVLVKTIFKYEKFVRYFSYTVRGETVPIALTFYVCQIRKAVLNKFLM